MITWSLARVRSFRQTAWKCGPSRVITWPKILSFRFKVVFRPGPSRNFSSKSKQNFSTADFWRIRDFWMFFAEFRTENVQKKWFHETLVSFSVMFHSVEKREILSHQNFFRPIKLIDWINSLVSYLVKPLLSRNFCQKCVWKFQAFLPLRIRIYVKSISGVLEAKALTRS